MIISSCVNSLLKKEKYYDDNYLEIELLIKNYLNQLIYLN